MIKVWVDGKLLPPQKIEVDAKTKLVTIKWTKWELLWQKLRAQAGRPVHVAMVYEYDAGDQPMVARQDIYGGGVSSYSQHPRGWLGEDEDRGK